MPKHLWLPWDEGEDPETEPQRLFLDLMIEHTGRMGFGCLVHVDSDPEASERLKQALNECVTQQLLKELMKLDPPV